VDGTVLIQNPAFEGNSWTLWEVEGTFGNQRFNGAAETWHSTGFVMQQTLQGMPAGRYEISCQMANGEGEDTGYLFATAGGNTETAVVKQSCAGSDFDTERNKMANNSRYGLLTVESFVGEDGKLTFGLKEPSDGTTWLVFDNFSLTYYGPVADGIDEIVSDTTIIHKTDDSIYDLSGRKMTAPLRRGIYIQGGRKMVVR